MRKLALGIALMLVLTACSGEAATTTSSLVTTTTTTTAPSPASTSVTTAEGIVVSSAADSGPGTLRQALREARAGDTIIFDAVVFPPEDPVSIMLDSELPYIKQGNLTIDVSDAGVVLDGSKITGSDRHGFQVYSDGNTIRGMQVVGFSGAGILLSESRFNTIGGDRGNGSGPTGQGNLISGNLFGIALWGGASNNTVTGNVIGTEASGSVAWANNVGILLMERANDNTIGPNNVIAFNAEFGFSIQADSLANTIILNSIHSNGVGDVDLYSQANSEVDPPLVFDFDLAAGTVTGAACASCTVNIYSDADQVIPVFEGQTTSNNLGGFNILDKDAPFTGPNLTATATDADGNTSGFSWPTSGERSSALIQLGNDLPRIRFQPRTSGELAPNRIGGMWPMAPGASAQQIRYTVEGIKRLGLKWINSGFDFFDWPEVEESGLYSEFHITAAEDAAIDEYVANGIEVMATIMFWDQEILNEMGDDYTSRFRTEQEIERWLEYVRFLVRHFKGRIAYYHIWNEPHIPWQPLQHIELPDHIELIRRTIPVIRQEDPEAKIAIGSLAGMHEEGRDYTIGLVSSDIAPLVDAISWNPFLGGSSPGMPKRYDEDSGGAEHYYGYPLLVEEIRDVASAHGFTGEYIAKEMLWASPTSSGPADLHTYSEIEAAKYYARVIIINLGMDITVGLAAVRADPGTQALRPVETVLQNLSTLMAGTEPANLAIEILSEATDMRSYGFALPDGDRLLALWTDGVAQDNDPGVEATLTIPGLAAQQVTAIDPLHSFEQELVTTVEDGLLVIRGLLVNDYPIFLRFASAASP